MLKEQRVWCLLITNSQHKWTQVRTERDTGTDGDSERDKETVGDRQGDMWKGFSLAKGKANAH